MTDAAGQTTVPPLSGAAISAPTQPIVLTGFMGTGKSTVGRLVAAMLDATFVDTDQLIEAEHGPIPEIFQLYGEERFRQMERSTADDLARRIAGEPDQRLVIATGGRFMLDPHNVAVLASRARVVALAAEADEIVARVLADDSGPPRPLLDADDPAARVRSLLDERANGYARFPRVTTSDRTPDEIAEEIVRVAACEPVRFLVDRAATAALDVQVGIGSLAAVGRANDRTAAVIVQGEDAERYLPLLTINPDTDIVVCLDNADDTLGLRHTLEQAGTDTIIALGELSALAAAVDTLAPNTLAPNTMASDTMASDAPCATQALPADERSVSNGFHPTVIGCPTDVHTLIEAIDAPAPVERIVVDVAALQQLDTHRILPDDTHELRALVLDEVRATIEG